MARLSGTGLIADELYLMAHDDMTGRPFLQPRAIVLGLAGGLLAELMLLDKLRLSHRWVVTGVDGTFIWTPRSLPAPRSGCPSLAAVWSCRRRRPR